MFISLREWKRSPDERDFTMIGKVAGKVGPAVGIWNLAVAAEIDAAQDDASSRLIDEPSPLDMETRHR
jgi:hypothetical protein